MWSTFWYLAFCLKKFRSNPILRPFSSRYVFGACRCSLLEPESTFAFTWSNLFLSLSFKFLIKKENKTRRAEVDSLTWTRREFENPPTSFTTATKCHSLASIPTFFFLCQLYPRRRLLLCYFGFAIAALNAKKVKHDASTTWEKNARRGRAVLLK